MTETSPPPRPTREYKVGDKVPMVKETPVVRPKRFVDSPAKGPRGVFTNGRS